MPSEPLTQPVAAIMRPVPAMEPEDTLARAARLLSDLPFGMLPVMRDGKLLGAITPEAMAVALADGHVYTDAVESVLDKNPPTISLQASGAEALRKLVSNGRPWLFVVDENSEVRGVIGATDLFPRASLAVRPAMVGGMATPFGVYLTTGVIRAGASDLALISTGAILYSVFLLSVVVSEWLASWMHSAGWADNVAIIVRDIGPMPLFLLAIRAMPLSGVHAAEHKTVHAIERGEPLELDVLRRMPRVHPRCGTNIAVGATLFLSIASYPWAYEPIRILVAAVVALSLWRPLGNLLQLLVTTRPPTDAQLRMGQRAGLELLEKYPYSRGKGAGIMRRLFMSGIFHVITGSLLAFSVVQGLSLLFGWNLPL